jgi:inhibitor of KinA sporulation pathway (predicted exonuclease)
VSINYSKVVCFDMEMCCWEDRPGTGEIISIGLCELNLATQEIARDTHYFVKPQSDQVSDYCTQLTGITPRMVERQGRPLEAVLETISKNFGSKRPYAAWGTDAQYLAHQCSSIGIDSPIQTAIDIGVLYKLRNRSDRSISLTAALERAGSSFEGKAHNALVDAKNLARLIVEVRLL